MQNELAQLPILAPAVVSQSEATVARAPGDVSLNAMGIAATQPRIPTGLYLLHPAHTAMLGDALAFEANTRMRGKPTSEHFGYRIDNGSAIIPVMGTLISRGSFVGPMMGYTSYEGLRAEIRRAVSDKKVDKIVLAIDSPGGMVSGIDSVAQEIASAKKKKAVVAHVEGMAASAAYWIASQADSIVATPMSELGSIGVLALHADVSQAMSQMGVKMTAVYSGAHKIDGNPYEALPAHVRASMQKEVDALRGEFAKAVAEGRGAKFSASAALATEAQVYSAQRAVELGLADYTGSLDAVIGAQAGFFTSGRNLASSTLESDMELDEAIAAKAADGAVGAVAAAPAPVSSDAPVAVAPVDQKVRISGIVNSAEAADRPMLAKHLAFNTDLDVDAAKAILSASAKEVAEPVAPVAPAAPPSVEQRAQNLAGLTIDGKSASQDDVASLWSKITSASNKRRGFAS